MMMQHKKKVKKHKKKSRSIRRKRRSITIKRRNAKMLVFLSSSPFFCAIYDSFDELFDRSQLPVFILKPDSAYFRNMFEIIKRDTWRYLKNYAREIGFPVDLRDQIFEHLTEIWEIRCDAIHFDSLCSE